MNRATQLVPPFQALDAGQGLITLGRMLLVRRFEEEAERAFRRGKVGGYLHVYTGQEAVAVGILDALAPGDIVFTSYRDHAHALLRGTPAGHVMAELFGRATGICKGKGGSMHLFDAARGFYGGYGVVGGHIPLAVGAAYAQAYRQSGKVVVCYLGDGAMNIGAFHEGLNMGGIWGKQGLCPALFVIENNRYAMGTPIEKHSALTDLAARFDAYAIANEKVDGQDVVAVRAAAERLLGEIRASGRPRCIEAFTYRYAGHGAADLAQPYRDKREVEEARQRDPLALLERRLREAGVLDDAKLAQLDQEARREVTAALEFAEASPPPDPAELYADLYGDPPPHWPPRRTAPRAEVSEGLEEGPAPGEGE